ncbi:MAG TPA: biotin/lipoyl-containing protein, partial [Mycobacteriales bacterium]|nr:biotin/lipoyl-containing protein [Mycobacteriales bacterium]
MDPSAVSSTVVAPMRATVVSIDLAPGDVVHPGQRLIVLESMKMEHAVAATTSGVITAIAVAAGQTVDPGQRLLALAPADAAEPGTRDEDDEDVVSGAAVRRDLAAVVERHAVGLDDRRPDAVARRRRTGQRTTRENVTDLVDPGTFVEYGPLVIAAQRRRRAVEDLIATTPADGLVAGLGRVAGAETVVLSYDYTVLAGTQGMHGHRKKDRLFEVAERL